MNLRNYHTFALRELRSRGLSNFLFEEDKEETETTEEDEDSSDVESTDDVTNDSTNSEEKSNDENEKEEKIVQDPSSIDNKIDEFLVGAEKESINAAKSSMMDTEKNVQAESVRKARKQMKVSFLYESQDKKPVLDVEHFANQIARFVFNYDSLIDMPQLIIKRAVDFLTLNYDDSVAEQFQNALRDMHDLEMISPPSPPNSKLGVPNAVGARQASA